MICEINKTVFDLKCDFVYEVIIVIVVRNNNAWNF